MSTQTKSAFSDSPTTGGLVRGTGGGPSRPTHAKNCLCPPKLSLSLPERLLPAPTLELLTPPTLAASFKTAKFGTGFRRSKPFGSLKFRPSIKRTERRPGSESCSAEMGCSKEVVGSGSGREGQFRRRWLWACNGVCSLFAAAAGGSVDLADIVYFGASGRF